MHDIVFIHAPAFLDFRNTLRDYGPISDVIPSLPIFETYPVGFISLLTYLEKNGFRARIFNLGVKMIMDPKARVNDILRKIKAKIYAVDLHWMVHLNSSLYVARKIKEIHKAPILLGGLSATYYWKDLIKLPYIDFIIRGDSTEKPVKMLVESLIESKGSLREIPNLVWKKNNKIVENAFNYVPQDLEPVDYSIFIKCAARDGYTDYLPFASFQDAPITSILTVKGCTQNCIACGGSNFSYRNFFNRKSLAKKSVKAIIEELKSISERIRTSVFFVGDLQQTGLAKEILKAIREEDVDNELIFEFFNPPDREILTYYEKAGNRVFLQISPESHEEEVRISQGRIYTNRQLLKFFKNVLRMNFARLDVYFMIGLAEQTLQSAINTAKFAAKIISKKIDSFIAPLAPFIDPGSLAFEMPEKFGYRLFSRSLSFHSRLLQRRVWYEMLNYETQYLSRRDIAKSTYQAVKILIKSKYEKGLMDHETYERIMKTVNIRERGVIPELSLDSRILATLKELYPSRSLIMSLKLRAYLDALLGFICRCI